MTSSVESLRQSTTAPWALGEADDVFALARAREQAINVAQWLARIANSYVTGSSPADRVRLRFCPAESTFVTQAFAGNKSMRMSLATLQMQFLEDGQPVPHVFDPEEHSPAETEAWILVELLHRGLDRDRFSKVLPYDLPNLMTGDAEDYTPGGCSQGLRRLSEWYGHAMSVLTSISSSVDDLEVRCWPQTLDLFTAFGPDSQIAGFSPGSNKAPEPFFYLEAANGSRAVLKVSQIADDPAPLRRVVGFFNSAAK